MKHLPFSFKIFSLKTFLPRGLLGRSLLILIVPVLLIQVITALIFFDRHWSRVATRLAFAVSGEIAIALQDVTGDSSGRASSHGLGQALGLSEAEGRKYRRHLDLSLSFKDGAQLTDREVKPYARVWEGLVAQTLTQELKAQIKQPFTLDMNFKEKWVHVFIQLEGGVLKVALPQRRLFSSSGYIFLLWMMGSSFVLLMVAVLFMRNQIRPIRKLAAAAERFGRGRDVASFKPSGAREVRQAAQSFIDMHRRIRRQVDQRTAMLAGVSHDLRTPLTRLKLELEMLPAHVDAAAMKGDVLDMERMIGGYLDFVRGDEGEQISVTGLNALMDKVVALIERQGVIVDNIPAERDIHLMLRPLAFERALSNILMNAAKYADHIWISVQEEDGKIEIRIEDNGTGIPPDQYEAVFRPFYRVDASRNAQTGGTGLGLSIAMDIVQSHGGNIILSKSEHGGLQVCVRLSL